MPRWENRQPFACSPNDRNFINESVTEMQADKMFAPKSPAMERFQAELGKNPGKAVDITKVIPGRTKVDAYKRVWLIPDTKHMHLLRRQKSPCELKKLRHQMEFLTFIGKMKGANHFDGAINSRTKAGKDECRHSFKGWQFAQVNL